MFEIEHYTLPSEANANKEVKLILEGSDERRNFLLVVGSKDRPLGFVYASVFRGYTFEVAELASAINDLYVLPEFRGKGIGRNLLKS